MARPSLTRRDMLAAVGTSGAVALAGCGAKGGTSEQSCDQPADADALVVVHGEAADAHFEPAQLEVDAGDTVVWQAAEDSEDHQVRAVETPEGANWVGISTRFLGGCETYEHTFDVPGTYRYQCSPYHPDAEGTIEVQE